MRVFTGPPNGPVLFCWLAGVCRLSLSVTLPEAGRRARRRSAHRRPGTWAIGWPALHGGPVVLRLVRATSCSIRVCVSMKT